MSDDIREKLHKLLDRLIDEEETIGTLDYVENMGYQGEDWVYFMHHYQITFRNRTERYGRF